MNFSRLPFFSYCSKDCLSNLHKHNDTEGNSENDSPLHKAWRGYIEELVDSRSYDYA